MASISDSLRRATMAKISTAAIRHAPKSRQEEPFWVPNPTLRHVLRTILLVLSRPRFKVTIVETSAEGTYAVVMHDDIKYSLNVLHPRPDDIDVIVRQDHLLDDDYGRDFFHDRFPSAKMKNLRKVGLTIGNKLKNRVVHDVMSGLGKDRCQLKD